MILAVCHVMCQSSRASRSVRDSALKKWGVGVSGHQTRKTPNFDRCRRHSSLSRSLSHSLRSEEKRSAYLKGSLLA